MSLTLADLKQIEEKSDLENQIKEYENASRYWFDDEEDFLKLCKLEEIEANKKYQARLKASQDKKKSSSTSKSSSSTQNKIGSYSSASSSWSTIGTSKKKSSSTSTTKKSSGSGFSAAFGGDSDSD